MFVSRSRQRPDPTEIHKLPRSALEALALEWKIPHPDYYLAPELRRTIVHKIYGQGKR